MARRAEGERVSIVTRQTKGGPIYWVTYRYQGKQLWERIGGNRRDAERRDATVKRQLQSCSFDPSEAEKRLPLTVRQYGVAWLGTRTNKSATDDRQRLTDHVLSREWFAEMRMDDVRAKHMRKLASELKRDLGWKTAKNTYGVTRTMMRRASADEIITKDPCADLENQFDDGHHGKQEERQPYTLTEAATLVYDERIRWDVRVLLGLAFFAGLREGEVCGRRWRDIDRGTRPLWCMDVASQYGGEELKTKRSRKVPVHRELQAILEQWEREGFRLLMRRQPEPDDFIVPNASPWRNADHHTKSTLYKQFRRACEATGVEPRTLHSTRHTFITWARRFGADAGDLAAVTHNAKGTIVDGYTHRQWEPLCEAVSRFRVERVDSPPHRHSCEESRRECSGTPAQVDTQYSLGSSGSVVEAPGIEDGAVWGFSGLFRSRSNNCQTRGAVTERNQGELTPAQFALAEAAHRLGILPAEALQ